MPKRITRTKKQDQDAFRSGFNCGKNAIMLSMQITYLREDKKITLEDISEATKITVKQLIGLEAADMKSFMSLDLDKITLLANYFNVAVEIKFKSQEELNVSHQDIEVKTFTEELAVAYHPV